MPNWMKLILREAEGVAAGAAPVVETAAAPAPAADAGTVLFPNDAPPAAAPAGDWKEYEADAAKTPEENAALKAEHDAKKPAEAKADDPLAKVPEDGKYTLTMPDGVELDGELAEALGPEFKELGLTHAQAQKLVDKYIGIQQARAGKQSEEFGATIAGWADTAKKDPEIGGTKWDGTVQTAQRAVKALGNDALRDYLNASGAGNHPEVIRFMAKAGALIAEDNPASGGAEGKGKPAEAAYTLFPTDAPKG